MNTTTAKAIIHRGDPRFCRFISLGGEHVAHLEPSVDHLGMRLPYEVRLTDGSAAMFDTLAQVRVWVQNSTSPTIIEAPASSIRVGDIICATTDITPTGSRRSGGVDWFPHETVTAVEVMDHEDGWILMETTTIHGDYTDQMWFDPSWTFHIVTATEGK